MYPSLLPRMPQLRDGLGVSTPVFGVALLGLGVGGVVGSIVAPRVVGADRTAVGTILAGVALGVAGVGPALAATPVTFALTLAVVGAADAIHDTGMNRLLTGPAETRGVTSRMHGLWSVGALLATAVGAAAAALAIPVAEQMALVAGVAVLLQLLVRGGLHRAGRLRGGGRPAPAAAAPEDPIRRARIRRRALWLLAAAAVGALVVEHATNEWSAIALADGLGATPGIAGLGPVVLAATMVIGRFAGDRIIARLGQQRTALVAGVGIALGVGVALVLAELTGSAVVALVGFGVVGLGAAPVFPLLFLGGEHADGSGVGTAVVSGASRLGLLVVPPAVGWLAAAATPVLALLVVPVGGALLAATLPRALPGRG